MIFIVLTAVMCLSAGFGVAMIIASKSINKPCYGSLHYDKSTEELYLSISDESILDLNDGEYITLKFRRV